MFFNHIHLPFIYHIQFVGVETVTTVLADWRPGFRRYKSVITLGFCVVCYFLGLAHVTQVSQLHINYTGQR